MSEAQVELDNGRAAGEDDVPEPDCPSCEGTGGTYSGPCWDCLGTGYVGG